jgi:hypothetical protein
MGTDIHTFVEVDYATTGEPFGASAEVRCFNQGEFFLWHDYDLFDALGNGRSHSFPPEEVKRWALFPPRGLPANISQAVFLRYYHLVADPRYKEAQLDGHWEFYPGLQPVPPEEAARWVGEGWSHYLDPPVRNAAGRPGRPRVSSPNWHSASWLRLPEVYQALAHFGISVQDLGAAAQVILRVMEEFENRLGVGRSRLVFWFDN